MFYDGVVSRRSIRDDNIEVLLSKGFKFKTKLARYKKDNVYSGQYKITKVSENKFLVEFGAQGVLSWGGIGNLCHVLTRTYKTLEKAEKTQSKLKQKINYIEVKK